MPVAQTFTLRDFTGGLNVRENSFQLADNETPEMLNVHVDARGGIVTRAGWARWNTTNIVNPATWNPRNADIHEYSTGDFAIYIANDDTVMRGTSGGVFTDAGIPCDAHPHLADMAPWGDDMYFACGSTASYRRDLTAAYPLTAAGNGTWNDDYTTPSNGVMPIARFLVPHGGYMFCAGVTEDFDGGGALTKPNRLRWSHPNEPQDWAKQDFIDIEAGGSRITAIVSFTDHLLIFKDSTVWALFGYDLESWQLVQVSDETGTPSPASVTHSESAVYFYSAAGRGGVFTMSGGNAPVLISEPIRLVVSQLRQDHNVWLNWASQRLFCSLPWLPLKETDYIGPTKGAGFNAGFDKDASAMGFASTTQTTTFLFDLVITDGGAWEAVRPAKGSLATVLEAPGDRSPFGIHIGDPANACVLRLGATPGAYDTIDEDLAPITYLSYYTTNWKDGGTEELRKHWLRPRFIIRNPGQNVILRVDAFRDYDNTAPYRSWTVGVTESGLTFWRALGDADPKPGGFNWDDGSLWAAEVNGSSVVRGKGLGIARAIRLSITSIPDYRNRSWGIDAVTMKFQPRRMTT